jgi:amino acid transporter
LSYIIPVVAVWMTGLPAVSWETGSWAEIAGMLGGPLLKIALIAGGMLSAFAMFNALVMSYSRLPLAMSQDGMLPKVFGKLHPRTRAPWVAIIVLAIGWAMCLGLGFERLVTLDILIYGLSLGLEFVALVAVIVLSVMARSTPYFPIDLSMTQAFQKLQSPGLDAAALAVDFLGYVPQIIIIMAVVAIGLFAVGRRWVAVMVLVAGGLEGAVDGAIKLLVRRPRPEGLGIHTYQRLGDFTFPSGHVFSYLMIFGLLAYFAWLLLKPGWLRAVARSHTPAQS